MKMLLSFCSRCKGSSSFFFPVGSVLVECSHVHCSYERLLGHSENCWSGSSNQGSVWKEGKRGRWVPTWLHDKRKTCFGDIRDQCCNDDITCDTQANSKTKNGGSVPRYVTVHLSQSCCFNLAFFFLNSALSSAS